MELKTIVLDGVEYVLIPRETFESITGNTQEEPQAEVSSPIDDFEVEKKEPIVDSISIVESVQGVPKAQGKESEYVKRLQTHTLRPEDVMVLKTNFDDMPETPEIARNDFKHKMPPGKWGFYGPGVERDLG